MTSKARSKGTNKKRARRAEPGSTPTDRRLLAKARQEDTEGEIAWTDRDAAQRDLAILKQAAEQRGGTL